MGLREMTKATLVSLAICALGARCSSLAGSSSDQHSSIGGQEGRGQGTIGARQLDNAEKKMIVEEMMSAPRNADCSFGDRERRDVRTGLAFALRTAQYFYVP
jgi:hypothetical protein